MAFIINIWKVFIGLFLLFFLQTPTFAILAIDEFDEFEQYDEAVFLEVDKPNIQKVIIEKNVINEEKRFSTPDGTFLDLFKSSGYAIDSGFIKNLKVRYFFHGGNLFTMQSDKDLANNMSVAANEIHFESTFANNKTTFKTGIEFSSNKKYDNDFFKRFSFMYIEHIFNENNTLMLGQMRVPNGIEGRTPSLFIKLLSRSQIARTLGNAISNGIRVTGEYDYFHYDVGYYDASRFFNYNFEGQELASLFSVKPLNKFDGKYGNLRLGGSIDVGNSKNSFSVVGAHAIYNYKKFYMDFEYQYANGYAGAYYGQGRYHGLYTTASYFVKPNLELVARYDFFQKLNGNKDVSQEYTAGVTYYLRPQVKLMLNYIYAMKDTSSIPTHKVFLGADFTSSALLDLL